MADQQRKETISVHINGDRAHIERSVDGEVFESYRPAPLSIALIDAVTVITGYQPGLAYSFKPLEEPFAWRKKEAPNNGQPGDVDWSKFNRMMTDKERAFFNRMKADLVLISQDLRVAISVSPIKEDYRKLELLEHYSKLIPGFRV